MYLINTELTVNWLLGATDTPPLLASFDIVITPPKSDSIYTNNAILTADYVVPTLTTAGGVEYKFTPNTTGLWLIALTDGTAESHTFWYEHKLLIAINDTMLQKYVPGNLL